MRQALLRHQHGATLRELLLIVILLLLFIIVATNKIWELRVAAERSAVAVMIGNMRSALGMEVARLAVEGRMEDIARHEGGNPMLVMRNPHTNYLGQLSNVDPEAIPGYSWYYDLDQKVLVYQVANAENFETPLEGPARILFRLNLSFGDNDGDGLYDRASDNIQGLDLVSLYPYRWRLDEDEEE